MVLDAKIPELVMFEGNPFLHDGDIDPLNDLTYRQVKPYRADALVIEEA
jgi:hypothetical protein